MPTNRPRAPRKGPALTEAQLQEAARGHSERAIRTLAAIMDGEGQDAVRLAAAREMLDRAHGRLDGRSPNAKAAKTPEKAAGMTVIVKRFSDITPEEEAAADATERGEL